MGSEQNDQPGKEDKEDDVKERGVLMEEMRQPMTPQPNSGGIVVCVQDPCDDDQNLRWLPGNINPVTHKYMPAEWENDDSNQNAFQQSEERRMTEEGRNDESYLDDVYVTPIAFSSFDEPAPTTDPYGTVPFSKQKKNKKAEKSKENEVENEYDDANADENDNDDYENDYGMTTPTTLKKKNKKKIKKLKSSSGKETT